jgi:hypothetical protein
VNGSEVKGSEVKGSEVSVSEMKRLLAVVLICAGPAFSWGPQGHRIVALIAADHLTPPARSAVQSLLRGSSMAEVANWADDVKGRTNTGNWHFVNLAASDKKAQIRVRCPKGDCVTSSLRGLARNLKAGVSFERFTPAEQLQLIIHLVGDLHQPLHCATNADAGGNCLRTAGFGSAELHAVWDTGLVEVLLKGTNETSLARSLDMRYSDQYSAIVKVTDFEDMAMESHQIGFRVGYGPIIAEHLLPAPEPRPFLQLTPRECAVKASDLFNLNPRPDLTRVYGESTFDTVRQQLAAGGYRLAMVLNAAFK